MTAAASKITRLGALLLTALALGGCAIFPGGASTTAWVSSFGDWPAGRTAGSYVFDRLPSQQGFAGLPLAPVLNAQGKVQRDENSASLSPLERSAQAVLSRRGFFPAPVGSAPQVLVQVSQTLEREVAPNPLRVGWELSVGLGHRHRHRNGVSVGVLLGSGYDDPFDAGWPWYASPAWGPARYSVVYQRQIALVLRDAASSRVLYEARVQEPDARSDDPALIEALLDAALAPFPQARPQPQRVGVTSAPRPVPPLAPALPQ
ncbi:hypothetical protein [Amphibiibacter pelophylacis]|uniref:Uncharacterized protein n=1 Tax=Amphibiibacter pelophylacis TaxID=1799477 RepID=A0ACC6P2G4_9BURK